MPKVRLSKKVRGRIDSHHSHGYEIGDEPIEVKAEDWKEMRDEEVRLFGEAVKVLEKA